MHNSKRVKKHSIKLRLALSSRSSFSFDARERPFKTRSGDLMTCIRLTDQKISCECLGAMGMQMLLSVLYRLRSDTHVFIG